MRPTPKTVDELKKIVAESESEEEREDARRKLKYREYYQKKKAHIRLQRQFLYAYDPEKYNERNKEYYRANREKRIKKIMEWEAANKERIAERKRRRRRGIDLAL